jgi:hypothetical protein
MRRLSSLAKVSSNKDRTFHVPVFLIVNVSAAVAACQNHIDLFTDLG